MSAYLEEHLPHLLSIHALLGLPESALAADQAKIEAAIRSAVTGLVRDREGEVERWREKIDNERRDLGCLGRALGRRSGSSGTGAAGEESKTMPLPQQHAELVRQRDEYEKIYREKLQHIEALQNQINLLVTVLGAPFTPPAPLQPIPGPSRSSAHPQTTDRKASGSTMTSQGSFKPRTSHDVAVAPTAAVEAKSKEWYDVGDEVLSQLETALQQALEERQTRLDALENTFSELLFLHRELVLPPLPLSHPHHFPVHLLPSKASEETPGAQAAYERTLARYFATAPEEGEEEEGVRWNGMSEVPEPEVGLRAWADELMELWNNEAASRRARIQELYDKIEPLWTRLEIEEDVINMFMEMNRGSGEATIKSYEAELERCLELRRSSLSSFVISARKEIEVLWGELMYSDEEKYEFGGFINDDYSEELLHAHEEYAEQLRAEVESKANLLPKVREWHTLVADEGELERNMQDPNRFSKRGGAMLREEKLRKRVQILKPKVEADLLGSLPKWEEANNRPFMVQGERVVDRIHEELQAKEAAKEAKMRARKGLGPAKVVPSARPTPASRARTASQPGSTISRKREAPTPTPLGSYHSAAGTAAKRPRPNQPSTLRPAARVVPSSTHSTYRDPGSSPTPQDGMRNFSGSTVFSISSVSTDRTRIPSLTYSIKSVNHHGGSSNGLGKAGGRKPQRRESFKPRQSLAGGLIAAARCGALAGGERQSWGLIEEGEDDEVF